MFHVKPWHWGLALFGVFGTSFYVRPRAAMISDMGQAYKGMISAMMGGDYRNPVPAAHGYIFDGKPMDAPEPTKLCNARCYYPGSSGWTLIVCPLLQGHRGLHADENLFPMFTDEDAVWFDQQYQIVPDIIPPAPVKRRNYARWLWPLWTVGTSMTLISVGIAIATGHMYSWEWVSWGTGLTVQSVALVAFIRTRRKQ